MNEATPDAGGINDALCLGLSRSRLLQFDHCVSFVGTLQEKPDRALLEKALARLCFQEPLLHARIVLSDEENAAACVQLDAACASLETANENPLAVVRRVRAQGLSFKERLFRFFLIGDATLAVFGHIAVCDAGSLLLLTEEWLSFYHNPLQTAKEKPVVLLSDREELPMNVFSPLIDRVVSELNAKWERKKHFYTPSDYERVRKTVDGLGENPLYPCYLNEKRTEAAEKRCEELGIDVASALAFSFHEVLSARFSGKRNYEKIIFGADLRRYFPDPAAYGVGPFGADFGVFAPRKTKGAPGERAKAFHAEAYKKFASAFSVYYSSVFRYLAEDSLCDAAQFCINATERAKPAKSLAKAYGCTAKRRLTFDFYNLDQRHWSGLQELSDVLILPPPHGSEDFHVCVMRLHGKLAVAVEYRRDTATAEEMTAILAEVLKMLEKL